MIAQCIIESMNFPWHQPLQLPNLIHISSLWSALTVQVEIVVRCGIRLSNEP